MSTSLSPEFLSWVVDYSDVGQRDPYLWRWCREAVEITTLSCVSPEWREQVGDTKTLGVMFDVMLDDVADRGGSEELFETLLELFFDRTPCVATGLAADELAYADFTYRLWREINDRARTFPRYREFSDLLRFDYLQLCNTMRYSRLVNGNLDLLNLTEHDLYSPNNMHIMICSTFDVMCSPTFDRREIGKLREVAWHAQWMGRIGNLITTWEREVGEGDYSSGVFARAVSHGDLRVEDLQVADQETIWLAIRGGRHEESFVDQWGQHRAALLEMAEQLHTVDVRALVKNLEQLFRLHQASRGRK